MLLFFRKEELYFIIKEMINMSNEFSYNLKSIGNNTDSEHTPIRFYFALDENEFSK